MKAEKIKENIKTMLIWLCWLAIAIIMRGIGTAFLLYVNKLVK